MTHSAWTRDTASTGLCTMSLGRLTALVCPAITRPGRYTSSILLDRSSVIWSGDFEKTEELARASAEKQMSKLAKR